LTGGVEDLGAAVRALVADLEVSAAHGLAQPALSIDALDRLRRDQRGAELESARPGCGRRAMRCRRDKSRQHDPAGEGKCVMVLRQSLGAGSS